MDFNQIVPLLWKSERDKQVKDMLDVFKVKQPLARPKRGDDDVHVELPEHRMAFIFTLAESFENLKADFMEGELIFSTIFFWPNEDDFAKNRSLPFGINLRLLRDEQLRLLGAPEWSNSKQTLFRWAVNEMLLFLEYHENGKLENITFQLP